MSRIVLYTRRACPLCDEARDQLVLLGLEFVTRDVLADSGLSQEYGSRVPVIEVDGVDVFEGGTSPSEVPEIMREAGFVPGL